MNIKWGLLTSMVLLSSGCGYYNNESFEYRQVSVAPTVCCQTVSTVPVIRTTTTYSSYYSAPVDVTTSVIDYY